VQDFNPMSPLRSPQRSRHTTSFRWEAGVKTAAVLAFLATVAGVAAPAGPTGAASTSPRQATIRVVRTIAKEPGGFTQGLEVRSGVLYEGVGVYGQSELRTVDLKTGKVTKRTRLDPKFFAEGITLVPGKSGVADVVQLTWQEKTAVVWDSKTLREIRRFTYEQEGWGLCFSAATKQLIHSDGSSTLFVRDPKTFAERKRIQVRMPDGSFPDELNELECERNSVFANVWQKNTILEIEQKSGVVRRVIDASSIVPPDRTSPDDVLNGIAALGKGHYLLTGKRWLNYYEVTFVDSTN
jgi:glutaminyl-peptide cyclotransferase